MRLRSHDVKLHLSNSFPCHEQIWSQLMSSVLLKSGDGDNIYYDLTKLCLFSPMISEAVESLCIPAAMQHLRDVCIMLPDFTTETIGTAVQIMQGGSALVTDEKCKGSVEQLFRTLNYGRKGKLRIPVPPEHQSEC